MPRHRFLLIGALAGLLVTSLSACTDNRGQDTVVGPNTLVGSSELRGPALSLSADQESAMSTACISFVRTRDELKAQLAQTPSDAELQGSVASWEQAIKANCE
jgi:hypothetical protein